MIPTDPKEFVAWFYANYKCPYDNPVNDLGEKQVTYPEDHLSIIEIMKEFGVKSAYEIGTSHGYTSLMMSLYPGVERVKTIDAWPLIGVGEYSKMNTNITFEWASSFNISIKDDIGKYDMVFVDADHDLMGVTSDTRMAFALEPRVIVWHDYGPGEPGQDWETIEEALKEFQKKIGPNSNCDLGRKYKFNVMTKPRVIAYAAIDWYGGAKCE